MVIAIVAVLVLTSLGLFGLLINGARRQGVAIIDRSFGWGIGIGALTDFLDTLGIGSFVTSTAIFQASHYLKDERRLPGTLNTMHAIPTAFEALFFVTTVRVDTLTLVSLVLAATLGALLGSEVLTKLNQRRIQLLMGIALIVTAGLMAAKLLGWISLLGAANQATALHGWPLLLGIGGNFILGLLMSAGVGLYGAVHGDGLFVRPHPTRGISDYDVVVCITNARVGGQFYSPRPRRLPGSIRDYPRWDSRGGGRGHVGQIVVTHGIELADCHGEFVDGRVTVARRSQDQ